MKVLAINSIPSMEKGNTALILNPFLKGMKEAGAEVELFYTKNLKINPCQAEYSCIFRTPGECFQKDYMQMLYPKFGADVIILASPVYTDAVNGPMKNLMDRCLPLIQPSFEVRDGHSRHPARNIIAKHKIVVVSSCSLWELDNFDPLVSHMKAFCRNLDCSFVGTLLRPHALAFKTMLGTGAPVKDIIDATEKAGRQLMKDGQMSEKTQDVISRILLPLQAFIQNINQMFQIMGAIAEK
jgi:multimeric flavodoxin WrbA